MKTKFTPPFLYKLSIALMLITVFLPFPILIHFPFNLFGAVLLISGSYIAIDTKKMFKRTQTPINHLTNPVKLHTHGIFRFTRNPMYLGIIIGLAGIAIITGTVYNLLFPIVYMIVMDLYFVRTEEKKLEDEFGESFKQYKKRTRRWL
jgi:protein-S-isoprenylcysteine O-methyltransferase Ste14